MNRTKLNWLKVLRFFFGPKYKPYKPSLLKIQKSVDPNGNDLDANDLMFAKNKLKGINALTVDRNVCHYDYVKNTCRCGITLQKLKKDENCPLK
jgi:hypothetical protein